MSFRKERKYKLTIYEFNILKDLTKKGMQKLHEPRKINSLYYDNEYNEMFYHSEEGVLPRKKLELDGITQILNLISKQKYQVLKVDLKLQSLFLWNQ